MRSRIATSLTVVVLLAGTGGTIALGAVAGPGDRHRLSGVPRARVAHDADGLSVACCRIDDRGDGVAYFGTFAVDPTRQAAGIGRWLLAQAERLAAESFGSHTFEILVLRQQTALVAWYERRGFIGTGETRPFPGDERFARPLRDDLEMLVMRKRLAPLAT